MNHAILLLIGLLPLLAILLAGHRFARWAMVIAPLPALYAAASLPIGTTVSLPWLLLGVELGLDETGRVFLLFSGLLWLVASLTEAGNKGNNDNAARYRVFFLLAMAGNLSLIVAQDMVSFYLGFTLMGLAAYGLIVQSASQRARQAARRYLAWTIAGEMVLFVAIVMLAQQHNGAVAFSALASSSPGNTIMLLLVIGFGIKLALPGLHLWLPQAYTVTPTSAVVVLSGAMINAGLLGWLRFLPSGELALTGWGQTLMIVGTTGIFFGVIVGLLQQRPRLVLGYSSISKMGTLTTGMGAALMWPLAAPLIISALVIYATHHALVKGALFLGTGLVERGGLRPWLLVGLVFLTLAMAGAPLTSGALAKSVFSEALPQQAHYLITLLVISAFATTLLMARFLFLIWSKHQRVQSTLSSESIVAWLILILAIAIFPIVVADNDQLLTDITPLAVALLMIVTVLLGRKYFTHLRLYRGRFLQDKSIDKTFSSEASLILACKSAVAKLRHAVYASAEKLKFTWAVSYQWLRQVLCNQWLHLARSNAEVDRWSLAGSLWLGILGMVLIMIVADM
jgi:formate hydrogenlyase subunit 3/multisubunit Na+/H+ antiporter MnhD subunit